MAVRVSPIGPNAKFARIDQGVDWNQSEPYRAIGSGTVVKIDHGFTGIAPGDDWGIYIVLDHPVSVNGRTYSEVYYAETAPLVKLNQRVKAGQPVSQGGAAEIGFAHNGAPVAALVGGLGAGTQKSSAGQDFYDFVTHAHTATNTPQPTYQPPTDTGSTQGFTSVPPPSQAGFGAEPVGLPNTSSPTSGNPLNPIDVAALWRQTAQPASLVSPETQQLLQNALMAAGSAGS